MEKINPFIWFENQAEEAANFYAGLFPNSKINKIARYPKSAEHVSPGQAGGVMTVDLELNGTRFTLLNGGQNDEFVKHPGPVSFAITCDTQDQIDKYWEAFADGGKPNVCGWIQDKYGITWQVVPRILNEIWSDPNQAKVEAVTACFMKMTKFDIAELQKAYDSA